MKRILINATQPEELRVAIVDGQKLYDLDIETPNREQRKANVYKGKITRIEPSLEAAFVDYGAGRHGFLPLKEVARADFKRDPGEGRVNIKDVLDEGQELIVQVQKDERGNKGAALTTQISLAGRYQVLMPNNSRAGGVSRRIEGEDRNLLREAMSQLVIPKGMGAIARTAGVGRSAEELQWDLDYLIQVWTAIEQAAAERPAPFLIYQESNVVIRALRDYLRNDIGEVIIDDAKLYQEAHDFMTQVMPTSINKLKRYEDEIPLLSRFQVESQIESAFHRDIELPSGGSLVIDHTEALTSIDINSARATGGADIEETALHTNLEAADEIARQLRLRDLGGLVVIDFIDMSSNRNQRAVEERFKAAIEQDRARVQIGRISRFGLLEMSRQRLRPSLGEHSHAPCPRCNGQGTIRDVESLSLSVLRLLEEEALKDRTHRVVAQLPVAVASFLLNEKRGVISLLESRCGTKITLVPNARLETPHFEVRRIRDDQMDEGDNKAMSHLITDNLAKVDDENVITDRSRRAQPELAAVQRVTRDTPIPQAAEGSTSNRAEKSAKNAGSNDPQSGWWAWFLTWLGFGASKVTEAPPKQSTETQSRSRGGRQQTQGRGQSQNRSQGRGQSRGDGNRNSRGGQNNRRSNQSEGANQQRSEGQGQRQNRPRAAEASDDAQPQTDNRQSRNQRNQRGQQAQNDRRPNATQNETADAQTTTEAAVAAVATQTGDNNNNANDENGEVKRSRNRRGRRGGRRGRRPGEDQQTDTGSQTSDSADQTTATTNTDKPTTSANPETTSETPKAQASDAHKPAQPTAAETATSSKQTESAAKEQPTKAAAVTDQPADKAPSTEQPKTQPASATMPTSKPAEAKATQDAAPAAKPEAKSVAKSEAKPAVKADTQAKPVTNQVETKPAVAVQTPAAASPTMPPAAQPAAAKPVNNQAAPASPATAKPAAPLKMVETRSEAPAKASATATPQASKTADAKPAEVKASEAKPAEPKASVEKPAETQKAG